jgi:hypothetical protein
VALGAGAPDADVDWSADGRLAVGTARGEVLVIEGWTGQVLARRTLSEATVKGVRWSTDGKTLYAGEQSPDALVHALNPDDLGTRWSFRFADRVESSPPPPGEDLYGVYTLPGVTALDLYPNGDILVAATHAWDPGGGRVNRAQIVRLAADGTEVARWPDPPGPVTLLHPRLSSDGTRVVVGVGHSAAGAPPAEFPVDGVQVLDGSLRPMRAQVLPPLEPWFRRSFIWEGLAVDGEDVLVGFGDGRVVANRAGVTHDLNPGAPILAGDVPIVAPVGHAALHPAWALALTETTNIPWGAASPDLRPPKPHPGADTLWAWTRDGALGWTVGGPWAFQGLTVQGDTAIVGLGPRSSDRRRDLFGALVVDLGPDVADRVRTVCMTELPVFFRHAAHPDGRVAVIEVPWADGETVVGTWRVTVLR